MEIEHIFADQNEFVDALLCQNLQHLALELHDVVIERIVPFPHHFNDGKSFLVVGKQDFDVQGIRPKMVPLWVDIIVVNSFIEIEFVVFPIEKG